MRGTSPRSIAQTAHGRDPRFHLVVRQRRELVVGQLRAGDADDVLRLAVREADGEEVVRLGRGDDVLARELPGNAHLASEALDEPVADPERDDQRDLLRGDRRHERLERIRHERGEPRRRSTTGASSGSEAAKS